MPVRKVGVGGVKVYETDENGKVIFGTVDGLPPSTASVFARGCILVDLVFGKTYVNTGTYALPVWTLNNRQGIVTQQTNGTTAVAVWANGAPADLVVKSVYLISLDTTAGNITVENPASTVVCTIAKGATAGVLVGASSLANTSIARGTAVVVDSSSAGNAQVFIVYELA